MIRANVSLSFPSVACLSMLLEAAIVSSVVPLFGHEQKKIRDKLQLGSRVIIGDKQIFEGTIFLICNDADIAELVIGSYFLVEPIDPAQ
jgi:hypothetical protein